MSCDTIASSASSQADAMKLKLSGFCQDLIKHLRIAQCKLKQKGKYMGLELGPIGLAIGNIAGSLGKAGGGVAEGLTGAAAVAGSGFAEMPALAAPAVAELGGSLGKGLEFGPVMGLADMGPIINEGPLSVPGFINEGPVGLSDLQATAPWQVGFDAVSQAEVVAGNAWNMFTEPDIMLVGQPKIDVVSQAEAVGAEAWDSNVLTQAEDVLYQAQKPAIFSPVIPSPFPVIPSEERNLPQWEIAASPASPNPRNDEIVGFDVKPWVLPQVEPMVMPFAKTEAVAFAASEPATVPQPVLQEQEVEELVQKKVETEEAEENLDKEKVIKLRKYLVDQPALETVLSEAYQAYDKAEKEANELGLGKKVLGVRLAKLLPGQHEANTGGAVKPHGRDGTIPVRKEAIAAKQEFTSKKEVAAIILENRPVTIGENGEEAKKEEVSTTFRGYVVKPPKVIKIVRERIVKKKKAVFVVPKQAPAPIATKQAESKIELTLEELNPVLAGVFPKAA